MSSRLLKKDKRRGGKAAALLKKNRGSMVVFPNQRAADRFEEKMGRSHNMELCALSLLMESEIFPNYQYSTSTPKLYSVPAQLSSWANILNGRDKFFYRYRDEEDDEDEDYEDRYDRRGDHEDKDERYGGQDKQQDIRDVDKGRDATLEEVLHLIHNFGFTPAYPAWERNLRKAMKSAIAKRIYKPTIHESDMPISHWPSEYFALGVEVYYGVWKKYQSASEGEYRYSTRQKLKRYDPALYKFIEEVLPDKL